MWTKMINAKRITTGLLYRATDLTFSKLRVIISDSAQYSKHQINPSIVEYFD